MARILIADDDELTLDLVSVALEKRGHIVGRLCDGSRVKDVVDFKRPDVVILDCSMPELSGLDALRAIRASASYETPVLMLTGRCAKPDEAIAYEAGADDYLCKPFDPDQLVARVEALLPDAQRYSELGNPRNFIDAPRPRVG